ncbi:hypothetical protein [Novosphingobium sp. CF614]|uniref:hypothetical protein n=1 Tax=Novosphingobium sp. CF614 TaxID=1884364 RepID=UPI000B860A40|nr:hypothetical protein [Novosphingobium sp. CF614]
MPARPASRSDAHGTRSRFVALVQGMGVATRRAGEMDGIDAALTWSLARSVPAPVEFLID